MGERAGFLLLQKRNLPAICLTRLRARFGCHSQQSNQFNRMKARILVVDDEPDFVELISFNLRQHGYEVITAQNGLEALCKARRFLPDLVVLDVMMEGVDGYSVCEILRSQLSTRDTPVIMVTAAAGQIARLNGFGAGANEFFQKPVSLSALLPRMESILQQHALQRARELAGPEERSAKADPARWMPWNFTQSRIC